MVHLVERLSRLDQRLAARWGKEKAAVAVGHTTLVIAYHLLGRETTDQELGPVYFDGHDPQAVEPRLINRLGRLGYKVALNPLPAAP